MPPAPPPPPSKKKRNRSSSSFPLTKCLLCCFTSHCLTGHFLHHILLVLRAPCPVQAFCHMLCSFQISSTRARKGNISEGQRRVRSGYSSLPPSQTPLVGPREKSSLSVTQFFLLNGAIVCDFNVLNGLRIIPGSRRPTGKVNFYPHMGQPLCYGYYILTSSSQPCCSPLGLRRERILSCSKFRAFLFFAILPCHSPSQTPFTDTLHQPFIFSEVKTGFIGRY